MANRPRPIGSSSSLYELQHPGSSRKNGESNALETEEERAGERGEEEQQGEEEVEKLGKEVSEMAQRILHYRSTLPDQIKSTLATILDAQRPELPGFERVSDPGTSGDPDPGSQGESGEGDSPYGEDQETTNKTKWLKEKLSGNISAMPLVLKRMNDCISWIERFNSSSDIVHPAFKRKKS